MKKIILSISLIILVILSFFSCSVKDFSSNSAPISHDIWDGLLKKHVTEEGWVNYKGFIEDKEAFYNYLNLLNGNHPNKSNWPKEERLAYWINAYNAYTVQLIVENYPTASIKDIKKGIPFVNSVWDIKFIKIEERTYDLNQLEHGLLRKKFDEPRIHFAINCASYSCPVLRGEAYVASKIETQLAEQARLFLADERRNRITAEKAQLSKIFSWFGKDFTKKTSKIEYINQYSPVKINADAEISYLDYDWNLNEPQ